MEFITMTSRSEKKDDFVPYFNERQNLGKLIVKH